MSVQCKDPAAVRQSRRGSVRYLKDLFTRLPSAKITEIKQFTPAAWARAKAKEKWIALAA
jgi:hypothetical protein